MSKATDNGLREVWLPVRGYEGVYEVSNLGNVRRISTGRNLVPAAGPTGYLRVSLSNGSARNYYVHRIVLEAFCGPQPFEGAQTAHNDGNTQNNRLANLRWASPKENQADVERHGRRCRGSRVFGAKLSEDRVRGIRRRIESGERNPDIARAFNVSVSTIHLIRHNRIWSHVI